MAAAPEDAGGRLTLLAFLTTTCASCQGWWQSLATAPPGRELGIQLAIVTPSPSMEDEGLARQLAPAAAHLHMGSETWFAYGVGQAGTFVLVRSAPGEPPAWLGAGEVLGAAHPEGPEAVQELLRRWLGRPGAG